MSKSNISKMLIMMTLINLLCFSQSINVIAAYPTDGEVYIITSKLSNLILNTYSDQQNLRYVYQNFLMSEFDRQYADYWIAVHLGGGYYRIHTSHMENRVLSVENNSLENGARIQIRDYTGDDSQQWFIYDLENGYSALQNRGSGLFLDVPGSSLQPGVNIVQWSWHGRDNQQWSFSLQSNVQGYFINHKGFYRRAVEGLTIPLRAYSGFLDSTKNAIANACVEWNNAGRGDIAFKSWIEHNSTQYPNPNWAYEITKGNRGDTYLMETTIVRWTPTNNLRPNIYATEADIDINTSVPWGDASQSTTVFDIQNAITHEIGHLLGLSDDYRPMSLPGTMFGYGTMGELYKRTLDSESKDFICDKYFYIN